METSTRRDVATRPLVRRVAALAAATAGATSMLAAAVPSLSFRLASLERYFPVAVVGGYRVLTVTAGMVLVLLSRQLRRGRRRAWWVAVVLLAALVVGHVLRDVDVVATGVSMVLLGWLLFRRPDFTASSDPASLVTVVRFIPGFLGSVALYGVAAILLNRHRMTPPPDLGSALAATFDGLVGIPGPFRLEGRIFSRFFPASLVALGIVGAGALVVLIFRPVVEGVRHRDPADERRARGIVRAWGTDTLSYFALRPDKSYAFSAEGDAFLAYRYLNGLALVSGDPIGPPEACRRLLADFVAESHLRSWRVAVLGGREDLSEAYRAAGLRPFYLGDEAVVDTTAFTLEGRRIRKVRQSVSRLTKAGYTTTLLSDVEVGAELRAEILSVEALWRRGAARRGFTMALGRVADPGDGDCLLVLARDAAGRLRALLHLVPCYGPEPGYSLDIPPRDPDTPNGTAEFLIADAIGRLRDMGFGRLSLNFAAFGALLREDAPLTRRQRALRAVIRRFVNPRFQVQSLLEFNAKFGPDWVRRAIYHEETGSIPLVGLTYLVLEGFVPPWLGRLLTGRAPDTSV